MKTPPGLSSNACTPAGPRRSLQRLVQRLRVTRRMVIQNHQIELQSLRTEVLVRAQKLSRHRNIFFSLETQNHNRQVATDAMGPQARLRQTFSASTCGRGRKEGSM